jgi:hypothetical protein
MNITKQHLLSLLAASTLAAFSTACGSAEPSHLAEGEAEATSGGETESTCGGGACGAVTDPTPTPATE